MTTEIQTYFFNNSLASPVRITDLDGNPWFVAADVCRVLGYANTPVAVGKLDADEKMTIRNPDSHSGSRGGAQSITIINESGLYSLVLRSSKPEAKAFKRWITGTVLPSIRKHGGYIAGQERVETGEVSREQLLAKALKVADSIITETEAKLKAEREARAEVEAERDALAPAAAVAEEHFAHGRLLSIARFARTLDGVNTIETKSDLQREGYLFYDKHYRTYKVRSAYRGKLFAEKVHPEYGTVKIFVLPEGQKEIVKLYREGRLTLKVAFQNAA